MFSAGNGLSVESTLACCKAAPDHFHSQLKVEPPSYLQTGHQHGRDWWMAHKVDQQNGHSLIFLWWIKIEVTCRVTSRLSVAISQLPWCPQNTKSMWWMRLRTKTINALHISMIVGVRAIILGLLLMVNFKLNLLRFLKWSLWTILGTKVCCYLTNFTISSFIFC